MKHLKSYMLSALLSCTASVAAASEENYGGECHTTDITVADMHTYAAMTEAAAFAVKDSTDSVNNGSQQEGSKSTKKGMQKKGKKQEVNTEETEPQNGAQQEETAENKKSKKGKTSKKPKKPKAGAKEPADADVQAAAQGANANSTMDVAQLKKENEELKKRIKDLESQLDELNKFKRRMVADLAKDVDDVWMKKSFAELRADSTAFEKAMNDYAEFAGQDSDVAAAKKKMDVLKQELAVYMNALKVLEEKFELQRVNAALAKVSSLLDKTDVEGKKKELDEVRKKLKNYGTIVELFQDMVKSFKESGKAAPEDTEYDYTMIEVLLKQQQDDDNITAYNSIPWLKEQFEEYLKKDDKEKKVTINEEVGEEILKIVTQ